MYKRLSCILMMLMLTNCSFLQIRKPIIEQGNVITEESTTKLHKGMSPAEVQEIMGTPVLSNIFTPNRMEYVYTYQRQRPRTEKRVTLLFSQGHLQEILYQS